MPITNQNYYPNVKFLQPDKYKVVGTCGSTNLVLLGFYPGSDVPIVAKSYTKDPATEELWADDLYELLTHSQEKISIPDPLKASDFAEFAESDGLLPDSEYDTIADNAGDPAVIQEALDGWKQSAPGEFRNLPDADG